MIFYLQFFKYKKAWIYTNNLLVNNFANNNVNYNNKNIFFNNLNLFFINSKSSYSIIFFILLVLTIHWLSFLFFLDFFLIINNLSIY